MKTIVVSILCVLATHMLPVSLVYAGDPKLLKSNVVVVKPQYHDRTRKEFLQLAKKLMGYVDILEASASPELIAALRDLAARYAAHAIEPGHGSGWVWIPPDPAETSAFIVTNKHVAGQAGSVTIEFERDRHAALVGNQVVYSDPEHDISVIEIARDQLPAAATGFELAQLQLTESNEVWAVGFPGAETHEGQRALYSLTQGVVSNAAFVGEEGRAIAHTATINPGNSGGPLLVQVDTTPLGFRVAGMNTWKYRDRADLNLAIPSDVVERALRAAMEARATSQSAGRLRAALTTSAQSLANELGSSRPNPERLRELVSYSLVAERPEIISWTADSLLSGTMARDEIAAFLVSPVEYCRIRLARAFFEKFSTGHNRIDDARFLRITDTDNLSARVTARTVYSIAGKAEEIFWTWEHGAWRVSDATFSHALELPMRRAGLAPAARAPWRPGVAVAAWIAAGERTATGASFPVALTAVGTTWFGADVLVPLHRYVWLATGVATGTRGAHFTLTGDDAAIIVDEAPGYLQVPLALRLEVPLRGRFVTARLFGRAGVAGEYRYDTAGTFELADGSTGPLDHPELDWFDGHRALNVSALGGGGLELGVGAQPRFLVGVGVTVERHLLDEWEPGTFAGDANYRYGATRIGFSVTYQSHR